jgi:eukaryotic-like serine/threonine-protein kinase
VTTAHRFGPFYLDSRLAVGGTAEVYLARPAETGTDLPARLVVKRLLPHFANDAEGRTMFEREARLHAAVEHENVVTVFHAGRDDRGEPYLAMEYIDGVDGYRLLRKLRQEDELLPIGVSIYVAREVLRALESVHAARDPSGGGALGIVHRDVSPSNIYLSRDGRVKLGDFGIARSTTRTTLRSEAGHVLKGKFAYLAPEQVAGENSDHRADLFSLATVLAEMLLNRPLFPGGGQLAILLAIRDCKIDALSDIKARLPPGLFEVMQKGLARNPKDRYANAIEFASALAPFEADPRRAINEIALRVKWVRTASSSDKLHAVRDSASAMKAVRATKAPQIRRIGERPSSDRMKAAESALSDKEPPTPRKAVEATIPGAIPSPIPDAPDAAETDEPERKTEEYQLLPSRVLKANGEVHGPWTFARLMEALATGQIGRGDQVDFVGRGFLPVEEIEEFTRFFPSATATTSQLAGPGSPDFADSIGPATMLSTLMKVFAQRETGVLFAERDDEGAGEGAKGKKELYFLAGKLHHVASSNASELLGEYLVRRGKLEREELDLALAVLPRYGGRMGDTLISMGLVGPVDIFRAIREQGRDRVADLFLWRGGTVSFYRGHTPPHVEFPLDLELPHLILAGLETAKPGDTLLEERRADLDRPIARSDSGDDLFSLETITWPPTVDTVRALFDQPTTLREALTTMANTDELEPGDVLRAVELLLAAGLIAFK